MKIPLHYQVSEFDCGPTTVLNAMSYLFQREDLPAEIVRNIMIYCLDCYNEEGRPGGNGTSRAAMMFLSNWLNGFGKVAKLPLSSRYLSGKSVYVGQRARSTMLFIVAAWLSSASTTRWSIMYCSPVLRRIRFWFSTLTTRRS